MSMIVNRRDLDFLIYELLDAEKLFEAERYADYDRASVEAFFDTAQDIAETHFLPCAAKLDANEPVFDGKTVSIIPEVAAAIAVYREAGLFGASFSYDVGGMQMPVVISTALRGMFTCANSSISSYPFLTIGAANMLNAFGSDEHKATFLGPMIEGRWFGTMALSEPQAGSSLSDIRTKAEPTQDGHYLISGNKMWISGGEQEISENIVHMVLAKIPGGPAGVKGISLFIVPKYRVNEDGSLGARNNVSLAGLNHKMGHRGTTNTLLNFGEAGECHGYLVGEPHQGLRYMFHMMNEARIGVGTGAVMSALAGYLYSLDYARTRPQGRHPQDKDPNSGQVPIIEHADVRRLLMAQKAAVEGALSLVIYCSWLVDRKRMSDDPAERKNIDLLLDILTPVAKSWPSEFCLEANKHAIQVLGGYGYTRDYPVERFYRDNRLNPIHEGTHGIQGLDLLGRKVRMGGGAALNAFVSELDETITTARSSALLAEFADSLERAKLAMLEATSKVTGSDDLNLGLANATPYLDAFGHVVIAWMWLRQAMAAEQASADCSSDDEAFYLGKLAACKYFYRYELAGVHQKFALVGSLDDTCLSVKAEQFVGA